MAGFGDHKLNMGANPLAYMGVRPQTPAKFIIKNRPPTATDFIGMPIGTQWLYVNENDAVDSVQYSLTSVAENVATWIPLNAVNLSDAPNHSVLLGTGTDTIGSTGPSAAIGWPLISQGLNADPEFGQASAGGGGTGRFNLDQYAVLLGNGISPVEFANPVATVGAPLVSFGDESFPSFGVASVSGGGTGTDTIAPYSVVCGGVTSEGPLQTVSGTGTAGFVLTSNGNGALPSWQVAPAGGGGSGAAIAIQVITATGDYFPSASMTSCLVELIGAGAGGQSVDSTLINPIAGNGGGAGGYCKRLFTAAQIGASQSVTIGLGGATDSNGQNSTFGAFMTADGGLAAIDALAGGLGGGATGGTLNVNGGVGGISSTDQAGVLFGGFGGSNIYGAGGGGYGFANLAGENGFNYGSGGAGAVAKDAAQTKAGGRGADGVCIITEFGGTGIASLTGNTGGAVGPDLSYNIYVVGSGGISVAGDAGSNTLTISNSANPITVNTIYLTTPGAGTYTPSSPGVFQVIVECLGGGGGGGGAGSLTAPIVTAGGSGGGGGYARKTYDIATIGASKSYVVGTGGSGGVGRGNNGTAGGNTTFASAGIICQGDGGGGGIAIVSGDPSTGTFSAAAGGLGGSGTGDFVINGSSAGGITQGSYQIGSSSSYMRYAMISPGGDSQFGRGGQGFPFAIKSDGGSVGTWNGSTGSGYGSGGSGSCCFIPGGIFTGGNGQSGLIIITEYIS